MTIRARLERMVKLLDDSGSALQDVQADPSGEINILIDDVFSDIGDASSEITQVLREVR